MVEVAVGKMRLALPVLCLLVSCSLRAGAAGSETPQQHDQRMQWWREARFGLFIHWGVYAVPASEWQGRDAWGEWFLEKTKVKTSVYEKFVPQFDPIQFDAEQWVRLAKDAGMKYIVITSKHHDGFGMFRSELTDWCIKSTPFPRDPLKDLSIACKKEGIQFCLYHSILDWHHPHYEQRRAYNDTAAGWPDMDRYEQFMEGQITELLTRYGPIGVLWFDGGWEECWNPGRASRLERLIRSLQPGIIINNRIGHVKWSPMMGDFQTPEQEIPATGLADVDWESCMTMNKHWGYAKSDQDWKSTTTLVRNLIDCASKGGNYLLNVGPTAEGVFPPASVERLRDIGRWMKANGEAIYGTKASPFRRLPFEGRCTQKSVKGNKTRLFLHVYDLPSDRRLLVPVANRTARAFLPAQQARALPVTPCEDGQLVDLSGVTPDPHATVIAVEVTGEPQVVEHAVRQSAGGDIALNASDSELVGSSVRLITKDGIDNVECWSDIRDEVRWWASVSNPGVFEAEIVLGCPGFLAGSAFEVEVNGRKLAGTVPDTGGGDRYLTVGLGRVRIDKRARVPVVVRVTKRRGEYLMNLRAVLLHPRGR